jgi:hypothetical protein
MLLVDSLVNDGRLLDKKRGDPDGLLAGRASSTAEGRREPRARGAQTSHPCRLRRKGRRGEGDRRYVFNAHHRLCCGNISSPPPPNAEIIGSTGMAFSAAAGRGRGNQKARRQQTQSTTQRLLANATKPAAPVSFPAGGSAAVRGTPRATLCFSLNPMCVIARHV